MKILLINPPYLTLTSRFGTGHQIPAGLLMVGGPLKEDGHDIRLLDAELRHLSLNAIVNEVKEFSPQIVMTGHAGSTPAHPACVKMLTAIKHACPKIVSIYGGVYPTFHAQQILEQEEAVDVIVRGEGEAVSLDLIRAIESKQPLHDVQGIAYRNGGKPKLTSARDPIWNLDDFPIGWDLINNWDDYQCFGLGRSAIIQFSRGCPHRCTYCGQKDFWGEWRSRDPVKLVNEIEWLYRTHDIRFISLADENPATNKDEWTEFLEEMSSRQIPVYFFTSIRTPDIVRDADILHLYKKAGMQYILLGIESVEPKVLEEIKKGSTTMYDLEACRLLKKHGIFSIVAHIIGLQDETWKTFRNAIKQLIYYNGDFVNVTHVTPHSWTEFGQLVKDRPIVEPDLGKWDYRHQILAQKYLSPWKIFLAAKWLEYRIHGRPSRLMSIWRTQDRFLRRLLIWSFFHTGFVWFAEIVVWLVETLKKVTRPSKLYSNITVYDVANHADYSLTKKGFIY